MTYRQIQRCFDKPVEQVGWCWWWCWWWCWCWCCWGRYWSNCLHSRIPKTHLWPQCRCLKNSSGCSCLRRPDVLLHHSMAPSLLKIKSNGFTRDCSCCVSSLWQTKISTPYKKGMSLNALVERGQVRGREDEHFWQGHRCQKFQKILKERLHAVMTLHLFLRTLYQASDHCIPAKVVTWSLIHTINRAIVVISTCEVGDHTLCLPRAGRSVWQALQWSRKCNCM